MAEGRQAVSRTAGQAPASPTRLPGRSWWQVLKRTIREFNDDNLSDWAAALTYYAILSIFPALLALVSMLGLVGQSAIQPISEYIGTVAPQQVQQVVDTVLAALTSSQRAAGFAALISIAVALWSASGYVAAFMRAGNAVYDMPEGRPLWKKLPLRVGITAALLIVAAVGLVAVVFTGDFAARAGRFLGLGETGVTVWNIAKWPILVIMVAMLLALLYWAAPNVTHPKRKLHWLTPGSALAVLLWIVASLAFAFYVGNFSSYNRTYAALSGVVVFLIWLWLSNIAVLLGLEFDAELARERAMAAGHPPDAEPYLRPRDSSKISGSGRPGKG